MPASSIVSRTLSAAVLTAVHSVLWLKSTLSLLYLWVSLSIVSPFKHKGLSTEMVVRDSKQLKKIPLHLAIIVTEEPISYPDLAMLVCWAFSFGIQWLSVYDVKGEIKQNIADLKKAVEKLYSDFEGLNSQRLTIGLFNEVSWSESNTGNSLIVLSGDDGHSRLKGVATSLCRETVSGRMHPNSIDASRINEMLANGCGSILDPNLTIVCGSTNSLLGYPPWCTRLTEIIWLSSHHKVTYQHFFNTLKRYASCQQRFGK